MSRRWTLKQQGFIEEKNQVSSRERFRLVSSQFTSDLFKVDGHGKFIPPPVSEQKPNRSNGLVFIRLSHCTLVFYGVQWSYQRPSRQLQSFEWYQHIKHMKAWRIRGSHIITMFVNFESFVLMVSKRRAPPTFLSLFCVLYVRILTCAICFIGP